MKYFYKIKPLRQESKMTCGIACARMLLSFYGIEVSEKDLEAEVYLHDTGTWFSDLAQLFLKRGIKTRIYSINLFLFNSSMEGLKNQEVKIFLEKRIPKIYKKLRIQAQKDIEYLDKGGEFIIKVPQVEELREIIKKQPILLPVSRSFLMRDIIDDRGHYIVVNGFDGENYFIVDPAKEVKNQEYKIKKEYLEYAWLANNRDSDGYLMEIVR